MLRAALPLGQTAEWESRIYREFERRCHHFGDTPTSDDFVEWLALMQHHGCPTRLLDFTYSFWAALYFAIESALETDTAILWLIDFPWLGETMTTRFPTDLQAKLTQDSKDRAALAGVFASGIKGVWPVNPYRLNQRLSVQQGVFLAPLDLTVSFEDNLRSVADDATLKGHVIRVELPLNVGRIGDYLRELHRMNVTRTSLYPGLDGFASDLKNRVFMPALFSGIPAQPIWS